MKICSVRRCLACMVCSFPGSAGDSGDAAMMAVFEEIVAPAAARFQPDIILVRDLDDF